MFIFDSSINQTIMLKLSPPVLCLTKKVALTELWQPIKNILIFKLILKQNNTISLFEKDTLPKKKSNEQKENLMVNNKKIFFYT